MKNLFVILGALMVFGIPASAAQDCAAKVGSCDYYDCLAQEFQCPANSILLNTAAPYCRIYESDLPNYSVQGQAVLGRLKVCLQNEIENRAPTRCQDAGQDFVNAHVSCYLSEGFCSLPFEDKLRIGRVGFHRLGSAGFFWAALKIVRGCADSQTAEALHQAQIEEEPFATE